MSSGSWRQIFVVCPYYRYDDGKARVTCEGLVDDSSIAVIFGRKADYDIHMATFCCKHYDRCEIARVIAEKYREE